MSHLPFRSLRCWLSFGAGSGTAEAEDPKAAVTFDESAQADGRISGASETLGVPLAFPVKVFLYLDDVSCWEIPK